MDLNKKATQAALRLIFRPIAKILLRAGVNWRELTEVLKATYVEVAIEDFGIRGRPTNTSRVAIMTGLTRREVKRLRDLLDSEDLASFERMSYGTRVLSGWHQDERFVDEQGDPRPLQAAGANPSFETLCSDYSGDVPATTMLKELRHVGAVEEDEQGLLVARTRYYMPVLMDPEQMVRSGSVLEDIGNTVAYNLHRGSGDPTQFERRATNTRIPPEAVPAFREYIEKEGQDFLERVDTWLTDNEDASADKGKRVRLGLGAYWIQEDIPERAN